MNLVDVVEIIHNYGYVGIGGSRNPKQQSIVECIKLISALERSQTVLVGCQRGIDAYARCLHKNTNIFKVEGKEKYHYVKRTVKCIEATERLKGIWISFPLGTMPNSIHISSKYQDCFNGSGSGSWAGIAYARGLGIPVLIYQQTSKFKYEWDFNPGRKTETKQLSLFE